MKHFRFTSFLTTNANFEDNFIAKLTEQCSFKNITKDEFLLQEGGYCKHTFFVEKGLLRQYSIDDKGKEHIIQFAPENWLVTDRDSVFFAKPSQYYIQAVEDSVVLFIEEKLILELSQKDKSFHEYNNRLLHNHIKNLQKRINMLLGATAQERYLDFTNTYPDILLRVPQIMVASYLGIAPESLSRVRKNLSQKNHHRTS
jgi:CRP-like cAMP-binding protein